MTTDDAIIAMREWQASHPVTLIIGRIMCTVSIGDRRVPTTLVGIPITLGITEPQPKHFHKGQFYGIKRKH